MRRLLVFFGLVSIALVASSFSSLSYLSEPVGASDTTINVSIRKDVCWNIAGIQFTVPDGMIVDANHRCYTPPPPPVDVCSNIAGTQEVIPAGYYRDSSGNCYPQPVEPETIDVCPNIDGLQPIVPEGYINDEDGNCVEPPVDQCSNIDGVQLIIPEGMTRDESGACSTPVFTPGNVTPTPPAPVVEDRQVSRVVPYNVPEAAAPIVAPIVEAVPEPIKQVVRSLPPVVAQSFPYFVFAALGALALFMWIQAISEARAAERFIALLKRERSIAEQKDNFIALASHYLRTPLTVMSNGLDAIQALKEVPPELTAPLREPIDQLNASIAGILQEVEGKLSESGIDEPEVAVERASFLRSIHFWGPVLASIGITL
ncbi:HAMP domain-containing histidine kinase, partial [Candidatus Saccharibacteria bacterium]|nr:HAMP domain-containing histidine kinase [Candidatus Saccharibacteria bacterium]